MAEYFAGIAPILKKFGGRYLVAGPVQPVEGAWKPKAVAVMEFPSMAALQGWYSSPEYAPLLKLRKEHSATQAVVAEGFIPPG
ncbi:MAG: DUF1330 domain-containing protein [Thermoplasmata archaeon]|nr:DUF1330 domain-containing protein [Thermoplasmata archaeon]